MNPNEIEKLVFPLLENYDYCKGNRFIDKMRLKITQKQGSMEIFSYLS